MYSDVIRGDTGDAVSRLLERNAQAAELIPTFISIEDRMKETGLLPDVSAHTHLW